MRYVCMFVISAIGGGLWGALHPSQDVWRTVLQIVAIQLLAIGMALAMRKK